MYTRPPAHPVLLKEKRFTRNEAFRRVNLAMGPGLGAFIPWKRFKDNMTPDEVYGLFESISTEHAIVRPVSKSFFQR
jgi:hypothetical protein